MNKIPVEQDLTSSDHRVFAKAISQCQSSNPHCAIDGICHSGGNCFKQEKMTLEQALLEIDRLQDLLDKTQVERNQIKARQQNLVARLEAEKVIAIQRGKSQRAFALAGALASMEDSWL